MNGLGSGDPLWAPVTYLDDPFMFTPISTPLTTISYVLTVVDSNSCMNKDTVLVSVIKADKELIITDLFTPNGDGVNDFWHIENIEDKMNNEVLVYNIYGELVFSKKNYLNDWAGEFKGTSLPDGTYYYLIKLEDLIKPIKGFVEILR